MILQYRLNLLKIQLGYYYVISLKLELWIILIQLI